MVYIRRAADGQLLQAAHEPFPDMTGTLSLNDAELQRWLAQDAQRAQRAQLEGLQSTDLEMVRVLEDLVGVLIDRGVIRFTDLPEAAQRKLQARAQTRAQLGSLSRLLDDEEDMHPLL